MKFTARHSTPFYMVGADADAMRKSALDINASIDEGEMADSERVLAVADTRRKTPGARSWRDLFEDGVRAARCKVPSYYLFSC